MGVYGNNEILARDFIFRCRPRVCPKAHRMSRIAFGRIAFGHIALD
jgi:hypothetical protein